MNDGSRLIPEPILLILRPKPYLSTACDTGFRVEVELYGGHRHYGLKLPSAVTPDSLKHEIRRLHGECRMTHKFTDQPCVCECHTDHATGVMADCEKCRGYRVVPDYSNMNSYHGEPEPKPCPNCTERST